MPFVRLSNILPYEFSRDRLSWFKGYGPDLNVIYNAAYADLAGPKHPALFGMAGAIAWKEIWDRSGPFRISSGLLDNRAHIRLRSGLVLLFPAS